jgi:iron complex outermembrane recepter protein
MKGLYLSCASMLALLAPEAAMAQTSASPAPTPAASSTGDNGALADIVVTANKKTQAERLQDVPAAITALNSAQLDTKQMHTLQDLSVSMPNVQLEAAGTQPGTANFSIRGLGSNSTIPTIEPTVGIFIDGVYLSSNWSVLTETFDIDDVEVLRGPQGILFGRNVTGGAVLMHTARPTDHFQVKAVAGVESDPRMYMGLSVGGPISSTLKAKVSGWYENDNGFARNLTTGRKDGKDETYQVRGTVVWEPTSNLNFTVVADRTHEAGDGSITQNFKYTTEPFATVQGFRTSSHYQVDSVMLEFHYNPWDNGGFTMISSYRRLDDVATTAGSHAFPVPDSPGIYETHLKQYSNELRYAGKIADWIDFVTGVYYMHQDIAYFQSDAAFYTNPIQIAHYGGNQTLNSYAAFANVDVPVGKFTASLGARVSRDEKSAEVATRGVNAASPCTDQAVNCKYDFHGDVHYNNFLPRFTLKYQPMKNFQIFATVQKGARSGGYNLRSVSLITPPGPSKDEKLTDYEVGFKADLFNRHLRVNATGFINNIDDIQRSTNTFATVNGVLVPISITGNAADGRLKGFEGEVTWVAGGGLSFDGSVGYVQGKYTKIFSDISGDTIVNATDYALKFPRLAPWTYSIGASYDHEIGSLGRVHANVNFNHRDANFYDDANKGLLPKQNIVNMTLALEPASMRGAKISAYVKNLTNQVNYGFVAPTATGTIATLMKGRVAGAKIEYKF